MSRPYLLFTLLIPVLVMLATPVPVLADAFTYTGSTANAGHGYAADGTITCTAAAAAHLSTAHADSPYLYEKSKCEKFVAATEGIPLPHASVGSVVRGLTALGAFRLIAYAMGLGLISYGIRFFMMRRSS